MKFDLSNVTLPGEPSGGLLISTSVTFGANKRKKFLRFKTTVGWNQKRFTPTVP